MRTCVCAIHAHSSRASNGSGFACVYPGGRALEPHNIGSLRQKYLLLIVFTEIAQAVLLSASHGGIAKAPLARER